MAAVLKPELHIRPMRRSDLIEVAEIEQDAYPFPWSYGIFSDCLRIGYCCRVLELDGEIRGYAVLSAAAGEAHLLNLCIAADVRKQGLGQALLDGMLLEAKLKQAGRLFLEVRPSNEAALNLYRNNRFRQIGRRPNYYPNYEGREDALVMVRHLLEMEPETEDD